MTTARAVRAGSTEYGELAAGRNEDDGPIRPFPTPRMDLDASELARLRAGEIGALEACYRVFGARVRRLCRNLLGRADDADDAAHDVFVKVFERAHRFTGRSRFSTWIFRVTVNHCLHRLERERRRAVEPLPEDGEPLWAREMPPGVDEREAVDHLLAELPADQRATLLLREVEGLDYREIAEVLGIPVGTVMSRLHRARQRLIESRRRAESTEQALRSHPA